MGLCKTIWDSPAEYLRLQRPEDPVMFFAPALVQASAKHFLSGFDGLVTYAVKANPMEDVIDSLAAAGLRGYDCASPYEIDLIRKQAPDAAIHYNNPVRSRAEIAHALSQNIKSYSVDSQSELQKLMEILPPEGCEISVRFKLPVAGAAYNFGAKFGATAELATTLLRDVAAAGFVPSLTFHPGTQCTDPATWEIYIRTAAQIADEAKVRIARLNVGGGFPNHRLNGVEPALDETFALIKRVTAEAFPDQRPALICEPGRALCGDAFTLAAQIKSVRDGEHIFLNDGIYGSLAELTLVGTIDRIKVLSPEGVERSGPTSSRIIFGPTCDSVDRLPGELNLPDSLKEGDYLIMHGMGAYSVVTNSRFNGFGALTFATIFSQGVGGSSC